jgi:hypothetical protein
MAGCEQASGDSLIASNSKIVFPIRPVCSGGIVFKVFRDIPHVHLTSSACGAVLRDSSAAALEDNLRHDELTTRADHAIIVS